MARKYTKVEQLVEIVRERHNQGETYGEIAASYGLERRQVKSLMERQRRKERMLAGGYITRSAENNFEIMPEGVNKGLALQELTQVMGITMDEVMAIGDSDNDSDMLRIAGMPVVMGNGDEAVKKLAKYVTDTNDNDGVAKAIYKFI